MIALFAYDASFVCRIILLQIKLESVALRSMQILNRMREGGMKSNNLNSTF